MINGPSPRIITVLVCIWPPAKKSQLVGIDPDAGKDLRQERRGQQRMRWLGAAVHGVAESDTITV